ncbi:MAG: acyl-CoA thioesterase [Myxococcota bacterium]
MTEARRPADSAVETTHVVLPPDTNPHGTAFGGRIMQWMDIAAGIAAWRHCGGPVVTVAVDDLHFAEPIRMGDVVSIRASVNHTGRTSMEVGVRVDREEAKTGTQYHCLTGYFIFVAIDTILGVAHPVEVPAIEPQTEDEKRRFNNAMRRREHRLRTRKH